MAESSEGASSASSTSTQWPSQSSQCSRSNNNEDETFHFQEILNRALGDNSNATTDPQHEFEINIAIHKAAHLLYSCEVLLLVTGAGFSADSGLATYIDVADINAYREKGWRYRDLCRPFVLQGGIDLEHENFNDPDVHSNEPQDAGSDAEHEIDASHPFSFHEDNEMRHPQYFYGFWGQCINDYRKVRPHEGYEIIARWARDKNTTYTPTNSSDHRGAADTSEVAQQIQNITRKLEDDNAKSTGKTLDRTQEPYYVSPTERAGAFFFFTSNVDAHSYDVFQSHEIRECHGNTEVWQCRNFGCGTNASWGLEGDASSIEESRCQEEKTWERRLWRLPLDHVFEVNVDTMSAPPTKTLHDAVKRSANQQPPNDLPQDSISRKRKSESDLDNCAEDTTGVLNYLQHQFDAVDDCTDLPAPAHIGDVHGKPRLSHLKNMSHPIAAEEPDHYLPLSPSENYPRCPRCHDFARPAVLMFDDLDWVYNSEQEKRWQRWYRAVLKLTNQRIRGDEDSNDSEFTSVNDSDISNSGWENVSEGDSSSQHKTSDLQETAAAPPLVPPTPSNAISSQSQQPLKVLILEIGCGYNVPTCRMICETMVRHLSERGGDPTLVRINPTHPEADDDAIEDRVVAIRERGLRVLKEIDAMYQELLLGGSFKSG